MMNNATVNIKLGLFNVENLFLLFDRPIPPNYQNLTEDEWQKLSTSIYDNKPLKKCLSIASIILKNEPDIMMVCEVGGLESLKNFNSLFLDSKYSCVLLEGNSNRNIDVGFLIKKDLPYFFDVISNKNRPLHFLYPHEILSQQHGFKIKAPSQLFSRDCLELRLFLNNREKPFMILLLTHLKSRLDPERIDPGGVERRSAELRTVVSIYKELEYQYPEIPVLVCGDLNGYAGKQNPDLEFLPIYQQTDLQDIFEVAGVSTDKRSTFYQIKNGNKAEGKQIDYCFIPKKIWPHLASDCSVYLYTDHLGLPLNPPTTMDLKSQLPSDHYPLFFTLENLPV
ncbi:MAG: hypothetical protein A2622_01135 [Bdellovibrionales bacterium RIFCSPHIGHO2_01_FULL_40_29]|nr:MAG: hypothetical protein A2622_01135 [Bdellovibrionales bacterium RIFCSPHIGHO2_01_FULL_40_29]OFZ32717.1 MAG: hypothetical protein A3D17_05735 [Bdellovibrionales bacterium RIFCSPHIGHO2_02_FULL_40_15]